VRVLIADPDPASRAALRRALDEDPRFDVVADVGDAPDAIAKAVRRHPDLCLLSAELPGGGIEATWEVTARLPRTRVVVRAAEYDQDELYAAIEAGASGYVVHCASHSGRLPETLARVMEGEAAVPRAAVAKMLEDIRGHEPRRRRTVVGGAPSPLTSREWEVFDLLCSGSSTADIAEALMVSKATVRSHVASILRKLRVPNRAAAIDLCGRLGATR
jgi:DNA-binding NarL/FixJ family response regulator